MISQQQTTMLEEDLLPYEALLTGLQHLVLKVFKRSLSSQVHREMAHSIASIEESQKTEELLSFAKSKIPEKLLNIVSASVPSSILPSDCSADLLDIRINSRGPDDRVYSRHADIRMMIPRGTTIMQWRSSKFSWSSVVIYGHKKFTGGIGDEDDDQPESNDQWREYFVADPSMATSVVCMEKLNGEAAHISSRYIDGQFYLIVGSKNVHMLIRGIKDIDLYEGSRYEYAKVIARTVCDTLMSMDQPKRHLLLSFLHHTKCTLVGELLQTQNQHIVNLSHLPKPEVVVISMTTSFTGHQVDSLLAVPPHHLLDLCTALGLRTASYTVICADGAIGQKERIRRKKDTEGEVFYYLDANEDTIGLVKVKTVWYVILRALREKTVYCFNAAKKQRHWNISDYISSTYKRFMDIQKWLKFSDKYLQKWQDLAKSFLQWLDEEIKAGREEPTKIRPAFPLIWDRFLKSTEQSDQVELDFKK